MIDVAAASLGWLWVVGPLGAASIALLVTLATLPPPSASESAQQKLDTNEM